MALQITNTGKDGKAAAIMNITAPNARMREANREVSTPVRVTSATTSGERSKPTLPPAATKALEHDPAPNQRNAMSSRKVLAAVSRTPALAARQRSEWEVRSVREPSLI